MHPTIHRLVLTSLVVYATAAIATVCVFVFAPTWIEISETSESVKLSDQDGSLAVSNKIGPSKVVLGGDMRSLTFYATFDDQSLFGPTFLFPSELVIVDKDTNQLIHKVICAPKVSDFVRLFDPRRIPFDGIYDNDHGYACEGTLKEMPENTKVYMKHVFHLSTLELKIGNSKIFLRPQWHHEALFQNSSSTQTLRPAGPYWQTLVVKFFNIVAISMGTSTLVVLAFSVMLFTLNVLLQRAMSPFLHFPKRINWLLKRFPSRIFMWWTVGLVLVFSFLMYHITTSITQHIPHSQDEVIYLFIAKMLRGGSFYLPSLPDNIRHFFDHEFIVNNGKWFGMYTVGTPLWFVLGYLFLSTPQYMNAMASIITLLIISKLIKDKVGPIEAIFFSLIFVLSPFVLLQSGSLMSHPLSQMLLAMSLWALIRKRYTIIGVTLGLLFITRPYEGLLYIGLCLGFFSLFLGKISRSSFSFSHIFLLTTKPLLSFAYGVFPFIIFQLIHNYVLSGNVLTFPMQVYSAYNQIGFGVRGVEWPGPVFTPIQGFEKTLYYLISFLSVGSSLPYYVGFGGILLSIRELASARMRQFTFVLWVIASMVIVGYVPYYGNGTFYGPRYWYIATFALFALSVMGYIGIFRRIFSRTRIDLPFRVSLTIVGTTTILLLFVYSGLRLTFLLPLYKGYNGINPVSIEEISKHVKTPAAIFVDGKASWHSYGRYLMYMSPYLNDEVIFLLDHGQGNIRNEKKYDNKDAQEYFKNRNFYHIDSLMNIKNL